MKQKKGKKMIDCYSILEKVRKQKPLIHHITNFVTIYDCASVTRTIGALPVMAHAIEESKEMQSYSNALVLNIGTLTTELIESMVAAGKKANELNHPVVLDAVGAGATEFRTKKIIELLDTIKVDILKGNKSEIAKIAGENVRTKGVEASEVKANLQEIAKNLSQEKNCVVVITGKTDIVSNASENKNFLVNNGHELLAKIVGTGCMATSVIASFAAIEKDYANAAAAALSCYGIAAELAAKKTSKPMAFKQEFFDELYSLNAANVKKLQKIEEFK
jgi:hydroxyethylthiazole kinase